MSLSRDADARSEVPIRSHRSSFVAVLFALAAMLAVPERGAAQATDTHAPKPTDDFSESPPLAEPAAAPAEVVIHPAYRFHRPDLDYGSAARFGPLSVLVDRGFSTLLWESSERRPRRIQWSVGWANVWDALAHPLPAIERRGGWRETLRGEFLPENWNVWEWAFAANYAGHVVGGGQTYRALAEWYDDKGVPLPMVAGALSAMGTILVNEAIESTEIEQGSASTTFDVYVFEPIGIALFTLDGVADFFARELHAQDWSPQAAVTVPDGQLLNGSQMISYHVALPGIERLDLLSITGQGTQTGLLWDVDAEHSLGAAVGFAPKERELDALGRERIQARSSGGIYLSRKGSLVASLTAFRGMQNLAALNLYPGAVGGRFHRVGAWALLQREGRLSVGLTSGRMPGLGLGYEFGRPQAGG